MKSEDLLERKRKLLEEMSRISLEIVQVGKKLEKDGLEKFISSGEIVKPSDIPLEKLKKRLGYLKNMAKGLDKEIGRARKDEREAKVAKVQRKLGKNILDHERLNRKGTSLKVAIEKLKVQARALNEEEIMLKGELKTADRPDRTEVIKLSKKGNEVAEFCEKFYVADVEGLKKLMKETREGNKFLLSYEGVRPIGLKRADVFMGFQLTLDKDTGKILKKKGISSSVELITRQKATVLEVI